MSAIPWYRSLRFMSLLGLFSVAAALIAGTFIVMGTKGQSLVAQESYRLVEESGNNAVAELETRLREAAALTRSLAAVAENLPRTEESFKQILPTVVNFQGDLAIAGGGIWPEPRVFDPQQQQRSFFWGRDQTGTLIYYDDYNQPGAGYHREEWYVAARYTSPGTCSWSRSYMDPFSYQPMVTCTVAMRYQGQFWGTATIDLKLEGLQALTEVWQRRTGGYIFILDRDNKFITFPKTTLVKRLGKDTKGKTTQEFIMMSELAHQQPAFAPLAESVNQVNQDLLAQSRQMPNYDPKVVAALDQASPYLDATQAELLATVLVNPQGIRPAHSYLLKTVLLNQDFLLQQPAKAFIFHVPSAYWKLVYVKPVADTNAVAVQIAQSLGWSLLLLTVGIFIAAYILVNRILIVPLSRLTRAVQKMGDLVSQQKFDDLGQAQMMPTDRHEVGLLTEGVNTLVSQVLEQNHNQKRIEAQLREQATQLQQALVALQETQTKLIQSEKMSSLGQLVAGIAHEINNPVNFIHGNLTHACDYLNDLFQLLSLYEQTFPKGTEQIQKMAEVMDLDFLKQDLPKLLASMKTGTERIRGIVQSLRNFSRLDEAEFKQVDLHEGIDSTLMILGPQLKAKGDRGPIQVIRDYGQLPIVECYPGALNQVFMNLLANAIDAIREMQHKQAAAHELERGGRIRIHTQVIASQFVRVQIEDNGLGIPETIKQKIFDPFFTTKPAGKGTGLGLSISYQIITEKHGGFIHCQSEYGQGTRFTIDLPIYAAQPLHPHYRSEAPAVIPSERPRETAFQS